MSNPSIINISEELTLYNVIKSNSNENTNQNFYIYLEKPGVKDIDYNYQPLLEEYHKTKIQNSLTQTYNFTKTYFTPSSTTPRSNFRNSTVLQNQAIVRDIKKATCIIISDKYFEKVNLSKYYTLDIIVDRKFLEDFVNKKVQPFDFLSVDEKTKAKNNLYNSTQDFDPIFLQKLNDYPEAKFFQIDFTGHIRDYHLKHASRRDLIKYFNDYNHVYTDHHVSGYNLEQLNNYLNQINLLVTDLELSKSLGSTLIEEKEVEMLDQMFSSKNKADAILAVNIMTQSNIVESHVSLCVLLTKYVDTIIKSGETNTVHFKNMIHLLVSNSQNFMTIPFKYWHISSICNLIHDKEILPYHKVILDDMTLTAVKARANNPYMQINDVEYCLIKPNN
jgi:hypothetical protein